MRWLMTSTARTTARPATASRTGTRTGSPEAGGTSFDELRLLADDPNKEAWLIWSTMPDAAAKPAEEPTVAVGENETDLTPPLLGRAMMTGRRNAKPVRLVLVLVVN